MRTHFGGLREGVFHLDHTNIPCCSTFTGAESFPGPLLTRGAGFLVENNKVVFGRAQPDSATGGAACFFFDFLIVGGLLVKTQIVFPLHATMKTQVYLDGQIGA